MFEQSILIDHSGPRKTRAFAASLTAQIALAGVVILVPLIYNQTLTILPPAALLQLPRFESAPPETPAHTVVGTSRQSDTLQAPRVFRIPTTVPNSRPAAEPITFDNLDASGLIDGVPNVVGSIPGMIPNSDAGARLRIAPPAQAAVVKEPAAVAPPTVPIRMSGTIQSSKLIHQVVPQYPSQARLTHISGTVHLLGVIAKDGHIRDLKVLDGHPFLRQAALEAVRQWIYSPTILSGEAVEVEAPIDVIFSLTR